MSLLGGRPRHRRVATVDGPSVPSRTPGPTSPSAVTLDTALRHSAVWACLRVRADLVSTFPVDVFRRVNGIQVEVPKPPVLVEPGGRRWPLLDWMWASQFDLDRAGNAIGLITEVNGLGLPARVDLQPISSCSVIHRKGQPDPVYKIDGKEYAADKVWHERQYPVAGLPVGLSPIAYAAWSISEGMSMQQFALDWFGGGGIPKARLKNTQKKLDPVEARRMKDRYKASVTTGDVFVHGVDWELEFIQADQAGMEWLDGRRATVGDVARYLGCPVDLIEAAISAPGSITYQSALQRNLQFLVINLDPAVVRRERALSQLLPQPRYVKLNTDALLRMDPEARQAVLRSKIETRQLTVSEARELENRPPLTPEQLAEFAAVFGAPRSAPEQAAIRAGGWPWEQVSPMSAVPYPTNEVSP